MRKIKVFSLTLSLLFILGAIVAAGAATTIYVPDEYSTIQEAVNAAISGDTVVVRDTTAYTENVDVSKSLTIRADVGAEPIVQAADPNDGVFYVAADSVTIEGLTVQGGWYGIRLDSVHNCNISENTVTLNQHPGILLQNSSNNNLTNNTVSSNEYGIQLIESNNNTLTNNTASATGFSGIILEGSSNNTLTDNNTSDNDWSGINLFDSHWNLLTNNTALGNRANGIDIGGTDLPSNHNTLTGNTASGNLGEEETGCGIGLWGGSSYNTLSNNYVSGNKGGGIVLWLSSNNTLTNNTAESNQERLRDGIERFIGGGIVLLDSSNENLVSNNEVSGNLGPGIVLGVAIGPPEYGGCNDNEVKDNIVSGNSRYGIELAESSSNTVIRNSVEGNLDSGINLTNSSSNTIYLNNFVGNSPNAVSDGSLVDNSWSSPDPMNYSYTGSPSAGDLDGNGIGDASYNIGLEEDGYPLVQPFENYIDPGSGPYTSYLGNYWSDYVGPAADISATIDLKPDTLNLKSEGEWITCYIELPPGYDVDDIDVSTVKLNYAVQAEARPSEIGDYDNDGIPDLMVKFDRPSVQEILEPGDEVEVTVTGELTDGTAFEGTDTIRVIEEGKETTQADQETGQATFDLAQNYPNPFNPTTTIEYGIAQGSHVTLKIYSLSGQLVKTLVDEYQTAGHYTITWHGDTDAGQEVASGVYFCHIQAGDFVSTKKMVVLK